MKRALALALAALSLAGCGSEMADERGVFKTDWSYPDKDHVRVFFVSGAPNAKFVKDQHFVIDADEVPGGTKEYAAEVLLDCHVLRRRDPVKENPMDPDITDCKRTEGQ